MQKSLNLIFDSSSAGGNTGSWINVGNLAPSSSLNVVGLESGGSLAVQVSNDLNAQNYVDIPPAAGDASLVTLSTITGTGAALMVPGPTLPVLWLRLVKTPGSAPTHTTVMMLGQIV